MFPALPRFLLGTLRGRLIIGVAVVHAVMMTLFIADLTARQHTMLLDRQVEEASALSQSLSTSAAEWIAAADISGLQELVEAQRRYPEMIFAILVDVDGHVLADTDKSRLGSYLLDLPREAHQTVLSRTPALVDVVTPAMIGGRQVGWARVGIGQKAAGEKLAAITRDGIVYTLAAILIGSIIAWFMGRGITRRLYAVQKTIDAIRSGNHLARSKIVGTDEAAVMAREFNIMLDALAERDAELRAGEERYRSLIRNVQTAIVLHDGQGSILISNPLAQELLGFTENQLQGKALIDPEWHFLREDGSILPVAEYPVSKVLATRQLLRDYVIGVSLPGGGEIAWLLINAEPEYDDGGGIARVIVSFIDITGRKRDEASLQRLNRELRAISTCNQVLVRAEDEQTLISEICRIVCDEADYRMAWVGFAENDEAKTIQPVAWAGVEDGYLAAANISWADTERGRGPAGTAIRSGMSVSIRDFSTDPQAAPWRNAALQRGYRSCIALPLKDESANTFGILNIYSTVPGAFTLDEIRLLEELAGDMAFGIMVLRARNERKRVEEVLRKSETDLKDAQRVAHTGSWDWDAMTDTIFWSEEYYHIYGFDPTQPPPGYVEHLKVYTPESAARLDAAVKKNMETGEPYKLDLELVRPEGPSRWITASSETKRDAQGHIIGLRGTAQDITERKQAEEDIRRLNERFSLSTRAARMGVWDWNLQQNELVWDDRMYELYGVKREDFAGAYEAWLQGVHPDDRAASDEISKQAQHGEREYDTEFRVVWPDGSIHWLKAYGQFVRDAEGKPLRMTGINFDITARKQAEEEIRQLNQKLEQRVAERTADLAAANKELESFSYSVSHDLRAPLRHIDGYLGMLKERIEATLDEDSQRYMTNISMAARRMGMLIDDLLSFSRMGRTEMIKAEVNLEVLVQEILREFEPETKGRVIDWRMGELPVVRADRAMLRVALVNLLSNALKFTQQRERTQIEIGCLPGQETETIVFVRDNGVGFDMKYADKLFRVFERLHGVEEFEGTGIGLANVHRVISRHGGRTWAKGKVDGGATFFFSLPRLSTNSDPWP